MKIFALIPKWLRKEISYLHFLMIKAYITIVAMPLLVVKGKKEEPRYYYLIFFYNSWLMYLKLYVCDIYVPQTFTFYPV